MATTAFDPVAYKQTTTQQWQEAAAAWHRWGPTLEAWLGEATELMLDLARIGEGSRVLDVAAGAGGQTLAAARRVGPSGSVLATDISSNILEFAARGGARRRPRQRRDAGDGRREPRRRGRVRRRRDLARRPDLLPRPAAGARRDAPRAARGRPRLGNRLLDAGTQPVLLDPGLDHPPPRRSTCPGAGPSRPVQSRPARRPRGGVRGSRLPATPRCGPSTLPSASRRPPNASASSGSRSARSTRCSRECRRTSDRRRGRRSRRSSASPKARRASSGPASCS